MRSILLKGVVSISALLGVVAFMAATSAVAQMSKPEIHFSGNTAAAFGQVSYGTHSKTGSSNADLETAIESNLRYTVGNDQLKAIGRFRIRGRENTQNGTGNTSLGSGTQPRDVYTEIHWHPAPTFDIAFGKFQGQGWSQPFGGSYVLLTGTPGSFQEYFMNWTGISGLDLTYDAGVVQAGLAIATQCRPSCTGGTAGATITSGAQSIVPHLTGKFGAISIRAQLPQTSGKVGTTGTAKGSGMQVGVQYAASGFKVGLDIQSFTDKALASTDKDIKKTGTDLAVHAAGAFLGFSSIKVDDGGTITPTDTEITLRYSIPVGPGAIMPEIKSTKQGATTSTTQDQTNTGVFLIGDVGF